MIFATPCLITPGRSFAHQTVHKDKEQNKPAQTITWSISIYTLGTTEKHLGSATNKKVVDDQNRIINDP